MNELVSVIVPVYNVEPYLRQCIDSILAQTYKDLEVILVDDGSPDNCGSICDEYAQKDQRVRVMHKTNGGASSARNAGLNNANGEFIAFVDADDSVAKDYIETLLLYKQDVVVSASPYDQLMEIAEIRERYYSSGFSGVTKKIYRMSRINDLRFQEDVPIGEDILYNLAVLERIERARFIPYNGYYVNDRNMNSLTRASLRKYSYRLDEEYQQWWGKLHSDALARVGIDEQATLEENKNTCSIWVFQKILNQVYSDCPNTKKERLNRIDRQIKAHKDMILSAHNPTSKKTHCVIYICTLVNSPTFTYMFFKLILLCMRLLHRN